MYGGGGAQEENEKREMEHSLTFSMLGVRQIYSYFVQGGGPFNKFFGGNYHSYTLSMLPAIHNLEGRKGGGALWILTLLFNFFFIKCLISVKVQNVHPLDKFSSLQGYRP